MDDIDLTKLMTLDVLEEADLLGKMLKILNSKEYTFILATKSKGTHEPKKFLVRFNGFSSKEHGCYTCPFQGYYCAIDYSRYASYKVMQFNPCKLELIKEL